MLYAHFIYRVPNYMVIYSGAIFESDFQPYFSAKLAFNLWSPSSPCINGSCTKHHFSWKVPFLFGSQDKIFNQARGQSHSSKMSLGLQAGLVWLC